MSPTRINSEAPFIPNAALILDRFFLETKMLLWTHATRYLAMTPLSTKWRTH